MTETTSNLSLKAEILMKTNDEFNSERAIKLLQHFLVEIEKVDDPKLKC